MTKMKEDATIQSQCILIQIHVKSKVTYVLKEQTVNIEDSVFTVIIHSIRKVRIFCVNKNAHIYAPKKKTAAADTLIQTGSSLPHQHQSTIHLTTGEYGCSSEVVQTSLQFILPWNSVTWLGTVINITEVFLQIRQTYSCLCLLDIWHITIN